MKYEYKNDVKRLDEIVTKMLSGVTPMIDEFTLKEAEIRMHEIYEKAGYDDEDGMDIETMITETEKMKAVVEEEQRKASKKDVVKFKISEDVKKQIRDDMSVTYVRNRVSPYNEDTSIANNNDVVHSLKKRLSKLRRGYYHPDEWRAAITTILDAIAYARENEYPWMSSEEFDSRLKNGTIGLNIIVPILNKDYNIPIKDPEILKGIYTGEINVVEDNEDDDIFFDKSTVTWIPSEGYDIITPAEYKHMQTLASQGYDTRANVMISSSNNLYERFIPSSRKEIEPGKIRDFFGYRKKMKINSKGKLTPYSPQELMQQVIRNNDNKINTSISTNVGTMLMQLTTSETTRKIDTSYSSGEIVANPKAAMKEAQIFSAIKKTNRGTSD